MAIIADGWQQLQYSQSSFLVGAGITVTPVPVEVQGRILPNPEISFGNRNTISPQVRLPLALYYQLTSRN
jgi:hypothetical protein